MPLLEFQASSYAFALLLCTVAYSSYAPIRPYSATLIFGFIGGADLACVLDSAAVGGAGLDRVLDSAVIGLAAQYGSTNLGWPKWGILISALDLGAIQTML